mgnify:CR=1 FL=1
MRSVVVRLLVQAFLGLVVLLLLVGALLMGRAAWVFRDRFPGAMVGLRGESYRDAALERERKKRAKPMRPKRKPLQGGKSQKDLPVLDAPK